MESLVLPEKMEEVIETLVLHVGCEFGYDSDFPTPANIQVEARAGRAAHRILREEWKVSPDLETRRYDDLYGNHNRRLVLPPGKTVIAYHASVEVSALADEIDEAAEQLPVEALPDETLIYTLPSRYCLSDHLSDAAWQLFGNAPTGWLRVQAVCDWIHRNIIYTSGSSISTTTSLDVYNQRAGICRDFAHLGITLCRALNIPARYVFGYLPDIGVVDPGTPMDFHAWFEVFLGGRWRTFDARHNIPRIGRVPVGRGRDAVDCAMITTFGSAVLQQMTVWAEPSGAS